MRVTRRPNPRTHRSAISVAVRDTSAPQGLGLSAELAGSRMEQEVGPGAGSRRDVNVRPNAASFTVVTETPGCAALDRGLNGPGETEASARCPRHHREPHGIRGLVAARGRRDTALVQGLTGQGYNRRVPTPAAPPRNRSVDSGANLREGLKDHEGRRRSAARCGPLTRSLAGTGPSCLHPGLERAGGLGQQQGRTPRPALGRPRPHRRNSQHPTHPPAHQLQRPDRPPDQRPRVPNAASPCRRHACAPWSNTSADSSRNARQQARAGRTAATYSPVPTVPRSKGPPSPGTSTPCSARPGSAASGSTISDTRRPPSSWSKEWNSW